MARKLKTKKGRAACARRKAIIEPVFGQIDTSQGKPVLLRGLEQAAREWELITGVFPMFEELEQVVATGGGTETAHDHEPT